MGRVVGLDASTTMLGAHPPPVVQADATALPSPPEVFDAEVGPGLVASVFGQVRVERWDAPPLRLPDRGAVRDYLIARFAPPEVASAAAEQVATPATITKRGALIYARSEPAGRLRPTPP
jgi:hypothetical protein